ncbi:hypothetical protein A6302_00014 [Methylobrevis pamukkalensis]|uniref:Uncharacterized protein n=1 Tax=Methylobrevis pamukkalensis TaxID=1439726 RepID=A0A1E3H884_9HYPH|nr:hypothetical protein A6302_00014 [Methylobrevis pamukkalensis]
MRGRGLSKYADITRKHPGTTPRPVSPPWT